MFSKYLIVFGGVAVAGGVAATTLISRRTVSDQEQKINLEDSQEAKNSLAPDTKNDHEKEGFSGKLVFNKNNENSDFSRVGNVFYQAQLLTKEEYKRKQENEWKVLPEDDGNDPEDHITVELTSTKTKDEILKYLEELNEKIKSESQKKQNNGLTLARFGEVLKEFKEDFESNLDKNSYEKLLEEIQRLQKPALAET